MAQQINNGEWQSYWKPAKQEKKKPKYIKVKTDYQWIKTRNAYLESKQNHQGYYKCEQCGVYAESVDVHHRLTRGSRADLKYDLTNLVALCHPCHMRLHGQISRQS
jgi:hypothetical protein